MLVSTCLHRTRTRTAHNLIVEFCNQFQHLYGSEYCTPNMHMACHIQEYIFDYRPLASFWAFSFERYNGTLERTNVWCGPGFLNIQTIRYLEIDSSNTLFTCHFTSEISNKQRRRERLLGPEDEPPAALTSHVQSIA